MVLDNCMALSHSTLLRVLPQRTNFSTVFLHCIVHTRVKVISCTLAAKKNGGQSNVVLKQRVCIAGQTEARCLQKETEQNCPVNNLSPSPLCAFSRLD
jgi:hypothetical protein